MLHLRTFGSLTLHEEGYEGSTLAEEIKPLLVLAVLAASPGFRQDRDHMAALLWSGSSPGKARRSLRQALYTLSRLPGGQDLVNGSGREIALSVEHVAVDLVEFHGRVEAGDFVGAAELYRGRFLSSQVGRVGVELEHWIEAENDAIRDMVAGAFREAVRALLSQGNGERAAREAVRYADLSGLDEQAHELAIRTVAATGGRRRAIMLFDRLASLLQSEFEAEPSPELASFVDELRAPGARALPQFDSDGRETAVGGAPREEESDRNPGGRSRAVVFGGALVLAAALVTGVVAMLRVPPASQFMYAKVATREGSAPAKLAVGRDGAVIERSERVRSVPSPDGSTLARMVATSDGWDIEIVDRATGARRILVSRPDDDEPVAWAPDGSRLLYHAGRPTSDYGAYQEELRAIDLRSGREWLIDSYRSPARREYRAAWSPTGTRLAWSRLEHGRSQIWLAHADGSARESLSTPAADDRHPGWSPDGRSLVFASNRSGQWDLWIAGEPDWEPTRLTDSPGREATPLWLSKDTLYYLEETGEGRSLFRMRPSSGEVKRLSAPEILELEQWPVDPLPDAMVEDVEIGPLPTALAPGQYLALESYVAPEGARTSPGVNVRWEGAGFTIIREGSPTLVQLTDTVVEIVAGMGGWRADTIALHPRPVQRLPVEPAFREDWTAGSLARWITYGSPVPYVRVDGGPAGGVFVNNGDENFDSGAVSRRAFPLEDGLTLEAWGRMGPTGRHYEDFEIGFIGSTPPEGGLSSWEFQQPFVSLIIAGHREVLTFRSGNLPPVALPIPDAVGEWHRYALQVDPRGFVEAYVDGGLVWRSTEPHVAAHRSQMLHVFLGARSLTGGVEHGAVAVYPGLLYRTGP